jgi:hypothetical protein
MAQELQSFRQYRAEKTSRSVTVRMIDLQTFKTLRVEKETFHPIEISRAESKIDARFNQGSSIYHNATAAEAFLDELGLMHMIRSPRI